MTRTHTSFNHHESRPVDLQCMCACPLSAFLSQITHGTDDTECVIYFQGWWLQVEKAVHTSWIVSHMVLFEFQWVQYVQIHRLTDMSPIVSCHLQMLRLWRRDVPLSERLGEDSPLAAAPGLPPTVAPTGPNISWLPEVPLLSQDQPIFLMTPAAQAVSGFFVWTALILTCHQVTASIQNKERVKSSGH